MYPSLGWLINTVEVVVNSASVYNAGGFVLIWNRKQCIHFWGIMPWKSNAMQYNAFICYCNTMIMLCKCNRIIMLWKCNAIRAMPNSPASCHLEEHFIFRYPSCWRLYGKGGMLGVDFIIKPSQMEVAPLHRTVVISHKRRLFKNTKEI